jgi:DNA-3-methyladenine glycosylase II
MKVSWQHDPVMQALTQRIPPPQPYPDPDTYLFLLGSVISQQLSTKVARVIYQRFLNLFPDGYPAAALVTQLPPEQLRSAGLSQQKASYIQAVAHFHTQTPVHTEALLPLPDEEIIRLLTGIKGVGRWTAQMVLMFPLDRPDVFPVDDLGIQQSMIHLYALNEQGKALRERLIAIAENWRPHRTLASKYLWRARDTAANA